MQIIWIIFQLSLLLSPPSSFTPGLVFLPLSASHLAPPLALPFACLCCLSSLLLRPSTYSSCLYLYSTYVKAVHVGYKRYVLFFVLLFFPHTTPTLASQRALRWYHTVHYTTHTLVSVSFPCVFSPFTDVFCVAPRSLSTPTHRSSSLRDA